MKDLRSELRCSLRDLEYAEAYANSFQDMYLATQIKVLREQRELTQSDLGELIGTTQGGVSRIEDASYSKWTVKTLRKISRALHLRLRITLEEFGTLPDQVLEMSKQSLMRAAHENDPTLFPETVSSTGFDKLTSIAGYRGQNHQQYSTAKTSDSEMVRSLPSAKDIVDNQTAMNGWAPKEKMYG